MRLNQRQRDAIKISFHEVFPSGQIYLFGSRTDDSKLGGDIDLFLEVGEENRNFESKIQFLARLKQKIGDQKIDIVFPGNLDPLFEQELERCKILL